jgi:hypothetical protein
MNSSVFETADAPGGSEAAMSARRPFPLRTLMVCFTMWLIATEILIFDQVKFDTKTQLLEQAAHAQRRPQVLIPIEPPSNISGGAKMERL